MIKRILCVILLLVLAACGGKGKNGMGVVSSGGDMDGGYSYGVGMGFACDVNNARKCVAESTHNPVSGKTVLHFAFDSSSLAASDDLQALIDYMHSDPGYVVAIEGHTDKVGSRDYNLALGMRRASAVAEYLKSKGNISQDRIAIVSKGEEQPVAMYGADDTREQIATAHAMNRRAECIVYDRSEDDGFYSADQ